NYIKKFAFGKMTGIDLPGETPGFIRPVSEWSKLSISAIPMGQEVCVSVLQMARALAVIANNGYLVKPRILKQVIDNNAEIIYEPGKDPGQRIIAFETAQVMKQILKKVVDSGTGRRAQIDGYDTAGKTGTAQKIEPGGGYSHQRFIASFIGFAPVDKPRFVITVIFDEPKPFYYGGLVSAPVFKEIAEKVLKYLNVPKTNTVITKNIESTELD
ncbi:MAG: stage V sporulation protein D, partial [Gammaproteobacteria bacterium]|nr:stage V sporulation protein D [Gammaproteobacteria bacterium]